jgi:tetratricopeptide (TPR) repeat protein
MPEVIFPPNIRDALNQYMQETGDECSYISYFGIEHPERLSASGIDVGLLRLYAAMEYAKESAPDNALAALSLADAFNECGDLEGTVLVLESLDAAGAPGCYPDVWYNDPAFHLGWYLADAGRYEEAIAWYQRSLGKPAITRNWATWIHLGSAYSAAGDFEGARRSYEEAVTRLKADSQVREDELARHIRSLSVLVDEARSGVRFSGGRYERGVELGGRS